MFNLKPIKLKATLLYPQAGIKSGVGATILTDIHNVYYEEKEGVMSIKSEDLIDPNTFSNIEVEEYFPIDMRGRNTIFILNINSEVFVLDQCSLELISKVISKNLEQHEFGGLLSLKSISFDNKSLEISNVIKGTAIILHSLKDHATDLSSEKSVSFTIYAPMLNSLREIDHQQRYL